MSHVKLRRAAMLASAVCSSAGSARGGTVGTGVGGGTVGVAAAPQAARTRLSPASRATLLWQAEDGIRDSSFCMGAADLPPRALPCLDSAICYRPPALGRGRQPQRRDVHRLVEVGPLPDEAGGLHLL